MEDYDMEPGFEENNVIFPNFSQTSTIYFN